MAIRIARQSRTGMRARLEREAADIAERELHRRRAAFASLAPDDRDAVSVVTHRVASEIAAFLAGEAVRDERLRRTLDGRR